MLLHAQRLAGLEGDRRNAGIGCRAAQRSDRAAVVQDHGGAEAARQFQHVEIRQIAAQLRQVGAMKRAGVNVDEVVARADDAVEQRKREPRRGAALAPSREVAIQVAPIRQVAGAPAEAVEIDDRHADNDSAELRRVDLIQHATHDLEPIVLIAVNGGRQTQRGTRLRAVGDDHAARNRCAVERHVGRPIQQAGRHWRDDTAEHVQRSATVRVV